MIFLWLFCCLFDFENTLHKSKYDSVRIFLFPFIPLSPSFLIMSTPAEVAAKVAEKDIVQNAAATNGNVNFLSDWNCGNEI